MIYESVVNITKMNTLIRVWRGENSIHPLDAIDLHREVQDIIHLNLSWRKTIDQICSIPRVRAIEIRDLSNGDGTVIYTEWP